VVALGVDRVGQVHQWFGRPGLGGGQDPGRQQVLQAEREPTQRGGQGGRGQDADLGLLQLLSLEGEVGDEQGDGEPDPRQRGQPHQRRPRHREWETSQPASADQPARHGDPDGLPGHQAEDDTQGDGGGEGPAEEVAAELHPGVCQREQRHH
jgi:hypothetical protein